MVNLTAEVAGGAGGRSRQENLSSSGAGELEQSDTAAEELRAAGMSFGGRVR
jgi:hypothetical protein